VVPPQGDGDRDEARAQVHQLGDPRVGRRPEAELAVVVEPPARQAARGEDGTGVVAAGGEHRDAEALIGPELHRLQAVAHLPRPVPDADGVAVAQLPVGAPAPAGDGALGEGDARVVQAAHEGHRGTPRPQLNILQIAAHLAEVAPDVVRVADPELPELIPAPADRCSIHEGARTWAEQGTGVPASADDCQGDAACPKIHRLWRVRIRGDPVPKLPFPIESPAGHSASGEECASVVVAGGDGSRGAAWTQVDRARDRGVHATADAQLALLVAAPARHRPFGEQRAGVAASSGEGNG